MQIRNQPVAVGNTIYHALLGAGVVQTVATDRCAVQFASGLVTVFNGGLTGGIRTCYWQPVWMLDPPPDFATWQMIVDVSARIQSG